MGGVVRRLGAMVVNGVWQLGFAARFFWLILVYSGQSFTRLHLTIRELYFSGVLSLHLTDVPWKQALQTVVKSAGLVLRQEGNVLHVHSVQWQSENAARQDNEQARLQASLPLEHRSIILQYADASELAKAGEKLLSHSLGQLLLWGLFVSVVAVLVRFVWVFPVAYLPRWLSGSLHEHEPKQANNELAIISWCGMRGIVSLAAALALPMTLPNGAPFPYRDLIIFLTFCVIVITLPG